MNIKINKKILSLLLASNILLMPSGFAEGEIITQGDKIVSSDVINMRIDSNITSCKVDEVYKNDPVDRILSFDNGWDLVRYNNKLGFVYSSYFRDISDKNIYSGQSFSECRKMLLTNSPVCLSLGPSFNDKNTNIYVDQNKMVETLLVSNDGWYLVNYEGNLGFVYSDYLNNMVDQDTFVKYVVVPTQNEVNIRKKPSTNSDKYNILYQGDSFDYLGNYNNDWYMIDYYGITAYVSTKYAKVVTMEYKPVDFMKVVYIKNGTELYAYSDNNAPLTGYLSQYETGEVLSEEGDYYLVRTLEQTGYVKKNATSDLNNLFVVVDISEQKLMLYNNNKLILKTNVATGKDSTPTPVGKYKLLEKDQSAILNQNENFYVDYWMRVTGNIGIHDASWANGNFGGNIYHKKGSNGCIRTHLIPVEKIYEYVKVGTPVIIHE